MKIKNLIASVFLTILFFSLLFSAATTIINAATTVSFTVNLTISGNAQPTITWVQSGVSANPLENDLRTVYIAFNASDDNGFQDIDYSTAALTLNMDGEQQRIGSCVNFNNDTLTMQFNCSVDMQYYDLDGAWTISVSVRDLSTDEATDSATTFTYGALQAIQGNRDGITFGNVNLGEARGASNDPLVLDNTGNQNFTEIRLTAYDLEGQSNPAQVIPASSFFVNATGDNFGNQLSDSSPVTLTGALLPRDIGGTDSNANLYFWVDVPSAGLSNQVYLSASNWVVEVFP
jgi:hypothetical protein